MDAKILAKLSADFERDGYAVVENFLSPEEIQELRDEATRLVEEEALVEKRKETFAYSCSTDNDYHLGSNDKVRFFYEAGSFNQETKELQVEGKHSLAKIAHAIQKNPVYNKLTTSEKVKKVFKAINFGEPVVVQGMVNFKNPKVGAEYNPHQDASYLYTEPISVAGIWLALDDATLENGCLQFIPGSHKLPVSKRLIRSTDEKTGKTKLIWTGEEREYNPKDFVAEPVKKGALVLLHGLVVHRSDRNESDKPRWIYTFHVYDKTQGKYLDDNWLLPGDGNFISLYKPQDIAVNG